MLDIEEQIDFIIKKLEAHKLGDSTPYQIIEDIEFEINELRELIK